MTHEMNTKDMTCEEMMIHLWHFFNQHSSLILSFVEALLSDEGPGFVDDRQKNMLIGLNEASKRLRSTTLELHTWLNEHQSDWLSGG